MSASVPIPPIQAPPPARSGPSRRQERRPGDAPIPSVSNPKGLVIPESAGWTPNSLEDLMKWEFGDSLFSDKRTPAGLPDGPNVVKRHQSYRNAGIIWLLSLAVTHNRFKEHDGHESREIESQGAQESPTDERARDGSSSASSDTIDSVFTQASSGHSNDTVPSEIHFLDDEPEAEPAEQPDEQPEAEPDEEPPTHADEEDCPNGRHCLMYILQEFCDVIWPPAGRPSSTAQKAEFLDRSVRELYAATPMAWTREGNAPTGPNDIFIEGWDMTESHEGEGASDQPGEHYGSKSIYQFLYWLLDVLQVQAEMMAYWQSFQHRSTMEHIFWLDVENEWLPPGVPPHGPPRMDRHPRVISSLEFFPPGCNSTIDVSVPNVTHALQHLSRAALARRRPRPYVPVVFAHHRPLVLNIAIHRFSQRPEDRDSKVESFLRCPSFDRYIKANNPVAFREHLDLKHLLPPDLRAAGQTLWYRLTSLILHQGTAADGHWINVIRGPDDKWYAIDDEAVTEWGPEDSGSLYDCLNRVRDEVDSRAEAPEMRDGYQICWLTYVKAQPDAGFAELGKVGQVEERRERFLRRERRKIAEERRMVEERRRAEDGMDVDGEEQDEGKEEQNEGGEKRDYGARKGVEDDSDDDRPKAKRQKQFQHGLAECGGASEARDDFLRRRREMKGCSLPSR